MPDFIADLRNPVKDTGNDHWSQWSSLPMMELSTLDAYTFEEPFFAWVPYLVAYIGSAVRAATFQQERALIPFLRNMEQYAITQGYIQTVGFRCVGHVCICAVMHIAS